MMERYDCNAFTTPCKELCASRLPQRYKFVPCMTHSLNKDDRIPLLVRRIWQYGWQ